MKKISVVAVLVGGFISVVSSSIFAVPFRMYVLFTSVNYTGLPAASVSTAIVQHIQSDWMLFGFQFLLTALCSVFAGYMTAWMAGHHELRNAALSSILFIAVGIYANAAYVGSENMYLATLGLAVSPLLSLLGGYLRLMRVGHAEQFKMVFAVPERMLRLHI